MRPTSRRALAGASLAGALFALSRPVAAAFPDRPLRIVVPYVPGGVTDNMARLIAARLSPRLGQLVTIENRAGAGGIIGTEAVIRATPDGHTLIFATVTLTVYPSFNRSFTHDIHRALAPVTLVSSAPYVLLVGQSSPFRTLDDLVAFARANPGRLNFGSPGIGTSTHLAFEAFLVAVEARMTHVPYGGSAAVQTALLSGDVQAMFDTYIGVAGAVEAGQLRPLAVSSPERATFNPAIPTFAEAGLRDFSADTWFAILAPGGTPRPVVDRLQAEIAAVLQDPQIVESFAKQGRIVGSTPERLAETMVADQRRWAQVIAQAGITPQ